MDYGTNINLHLLLHLHWPLYISAILDNHRLYHIPRTSNKKLRERTRGTSARKNCEGLTNTHKISRLLQYGFSENLRWMNHLRTSQISDAIETWTFLVEALWSSHTQKSIETTPLKLLCKKRKTAFKNVDSEFSGDIWPCGDSLSSEELEWPFIDLAPDLGYPRVKRAVTRCSGCHLAS